MKKFTKLLAIVLTVVLTASTVLSVPFNVIAKEDPNNLVTLWSDEYAYFGDSSEDSDNDYDFKITAEKAYKLDSEGNIIYTSDDHYKVGIRDDNTTLKLVNSASVLQTYAQIEANNFVNVNDDSYSNTSTGLPYVTYFLVAPEDGTYTFEHIFNGGLEKGTLPSGGYFVTYCVNDTTTYKGTSQSKMGVLYDKLELNLVKGLNFVRVIIAVADFKGCTFWQNLHCALVDPRLKGIKNTDVDTLGMDELRKSTNTKYVHWPARERNNPNELYDTNNAKNWTPATKSQYDAIVPSKLVKQNYEESTENYNNRTWWCHNIASTTTSFAFCSKTIHVPISGYYQVQIQYGVPSSSDSAYKDNTAEQDAFIPFIISDPKTGSYKKYKKFFRSKGGTSWINLSVYLTEGENVLTITPPYSNNGFGWLNIGYMKVIGAPGIKENAFSDQRDPSKITTVDNSDTPEYAPGSNISNWFYATESATLTGIHQGAGGDILDENPNANRLTSTGLGVAGMLAGIYHFADIMQTAESMQSEGYLNKTYLPIVTYHVNVDTAGTYELQTVYEPCVLTDYSYKDFFIVATANDKEFKKAYFNHADATLCNKYGITTESCENCGNGVGYDGNGDGNVYHSHHSISSVKVNLEKGQNIIRCILATGETAPSLYFVDFEAIRLVGPSTASVVAPSTVPVSPATQACRTNYNVTDFTETDSAGNKMAYYAGEKKVFGHTHTEWPKYSLYDKTLYIGEIQNFSSFSIQVEAPQTGYFDIGLLFRYGIKNYKGKHAVFIDGYKHFYYAQDNTNSIYKNMMNISMYLEKGKHIITITCPTDYNYVNRIATDGINVENNWTDFGNMFLYGGLKYVGMPIIEDVVKQSVNVGRLEAEHFAYGNEVGQTRQPVTDASGDAVVGNDNWDDSLAQSFGTLNTYLDASNMRYVTFMVEAPADGKYEITPGYSIGTPSTNYYLTVLVNNDAPQQVFFKPRGNKDSLYPTATMKTNYNCRSVEVSLVKGINTITLLQGVQGNNEKKHNGNTVLDSNGNNYINFDYLDISDGLVGIPVHYDYDYSVNEKTVKEYDWDSESQNNVGIIKPSGSNSNVTAKGFYYSTADQPTGTTTLNDVWMIQQEYYNSEYSLTNSDNYKADTLNYSQLASVTTTTANNTTTTTYSGVPYISFKVKANKPGYYKVVAHFRPDSGKMAFYTYDQPYYISALVDGVAKEVGFEMNTAYSNEYDTTDAGVFAFRNRITFTQYLTAGEHIITLTAPLKTTSPIGNYDNYTYKEYAYKMHYDNIYLFGLETVSSAPSSSDIAKILSNKNNGHYNGDVTSDEEGFYIARGAASSAAIALKNAYNYTDPDGITNEFEDSEAVIAFVNEAIALIQYTDYKANGGYSYNGKDYKTDYQSYFDDILADLKQDIIDQKQKEFDAFKAAKFETVVVLLKGKLQSGEIDQSKYDQLYDLAQKQFDGIPYDTTKPVTTSARNVHALYGKFAGDLDKLIDDMKRFEEHRQECIEQAPNVEEKGDDPLTKVTETEYSDPQTVKDAIDTSVKELEDLVYDFNLDILDNIARLDEIITDLEDEADTLRKVRYYQSGIWMQYQLHTEVENQDHAFIRLFFEIDTVRNDYLDYGFYFTFTDEEYALPEDENPYKMSFYNVDPAKDLTVTEFASQTPENDQDLEYFYPYNFDKNEQANRFVFAFFIVPKEMFNVTYTFNAYVKDKNGEYIGKTRKFNLYDYYTGKGLIL